MNDKNLENFALLDEEKVKDLLAMDPSKEFFQKLVDIFDSEIKKGFEQLKSDYVQKNFSAMSKISHRLRSTSLNLGAVRLGEIFRRLEYMNYNNVSSNEVLPLVEAIQIEFTAALQKLRGYL